MGGSILDQIEALKAAEKKKIEARRAKIKKGQKAAGGATRRTSTSSMASASSRRASTRRVSRRGTGASASSVGSQEFSSQGSIQLPGDYAADASEVSSVTSGLSEQSGTERSRSEISVSTLDPAFRQTMMVDTTWEDVKAKVPNYEEQVGEEIIMQMIELDPQARKEMGITTLRSERFTEVSRILVGIVDIVVCLVGPDMVDEFEEELSRIGKQCADEGIRVDALGTAISKAVHLVSGEKLEETEQEAWKIVFDHVSWKMQPPSSS